MSYSTITKITVEPTDVKIIKEVVKAFNSYKDRTEYLYFCGTYAEMEATSPTHEISLLIDISMKYPSHTFKSSNVTEEGDESYSLIKNGKEDKFREVRTMKKV